MKGGEADRAGLEDDDIVVEVNGVNVEKSSHEEVVTMIRNSGRSLEMLVASRNVYEQLKAKEVPITRLLLGEMSYAQVHTPETLEVRPETPPQAERARVSNTIKNIFHVVKNSTMNNKLKYCVVSELI